MAFLFLDEISMATVLITGTNRGIGLEFVRQFLARGDRVLAACRNPEEATDLQALAGENADLRIFQLDVADEKSMQEFVNKLDGEAVDIFVNNAGVYGPKGTPFGAVEEAPFINTLQVNAVAPLLLTQHLIGNLNKGKDKKLVYVTSKMGSIADNSGGGSYVYRASKTALNAIVKSLAIDLADEGFTAVVIHPGWVLTDMGGPNALIDTKTSVSGMIEVIEGLEPDHGGSFINYDGSIIPW